MQRKTSNQIDMQKLLIIVESPLSERDFNRFGITILRKYCQVIIADATPWLNPDVWASHSSNQFDGAGCINVHSELELEPLFRVGLSFVLEIATLPIRCEQKLARLGVKRIKLSNGLIPALPKRSLLGRILDLKYRTKKFSLLKEYLIARILGPKHIPPDRVFATGKMSAAQYPHHQSKLIGAHALDYDIYLRCRNNGRSIGQSYWVYIDEAPCSHGDFRNLNIRPVATPKTYYPRLLLFFEQFERITACKIVIAAHPRNTWQDHLALLGGRTPIHGKTAELIRDANGVFAHASTSISFAVLWRKPIVILTSDEINDSIYRDEVLIRRDILRTTLLNLDRVSPSDLRTEVLSQIDEDAYAEYQANYIKVPGTPERPAWETWAHALLDETASPFYMQPQP